MKQVKETTQIFATAMSEQLDAIARMMVISIAWSCADLLDKDRYTDLQPRAGPETT